jgi:uncharacterized protein (TIGR02594 family)
MQEKGKDKDLVIDLSKGKSPAETYKAYCSKALANSNLAEVRFNQITQTSYAVVKTEEQKTVDEEEESGDPSDPSWIKTAKKEIGVKEDVNEDGKPLNKGERVDEYLKSSGTASPNMWCGAFVTWCLKQNKIDVVKGGAVSGNWKSYGVKLDKPAVGAIVIFDFGHVGFLLGETKKGDYVVLGGNQSQMVKISSFSKEGTTLVFPKGYTPNYNIPTLDAKGNATTR